MFHSLLTARSNRYATPFFSSIIQTLKLEFNSAFIGYMNGDLLLHSSFIDSVGFMYRTVVREHPNAPLMLMGRRYNHNMDLRASLALYNDTLDAFIEQYTQFSDQFISVAQDYFVFTPSTLRFSDLLDVVIGRNGYDNYLVDFCVKHDIPLVDMSHSGRRSSSSSR